MNSRDFNKYLDKIPSECIAVRISIISKEILNRYNRALLPLELKITQMFILVLSSRSDGVRPTHLCDALQADMSTLSRNIERMRTNGWVNWGKNRFDRGKVLNVTPKGQRLLKRAIPVWQKVQKNVIELISKAEAERVFNLTQILLDDDTRAFFNKFMSTSVTARQVPKSGRQRINHGIN